MYLNSLLGTSDIRRTAEGDPLRHTVGLARAAGSEYRTAACKPPHNEADPRKRPRHPPTPSQSFPQLEMTVVISPVQIQHLGCQGHSGCPSLVVPPEELVDAVGCESGVLGYVGVVTEQVTQQQLHTSDAP